MTGHAYKRTRIFYFASVHRRPPTNAAGSAERNKVLGICDALATMGVQPIVVGIAPSGLPRHGVSRLRRTLFVETSTLGHGPLRRAMAVFGQAITGLRIVRRGDRVILYNYFPEYLLLALLLKLRGTPATLDIEDGPAETNWPMNRLLNRLLYRLTLPLVAPGKLIVAHSLAERLGIDPHLAIYGVRSADPVASPARLSGKRIRINFGGTLTPATGLDLFRATLTWLVEHAPAAPLHFLVTGRMPDGALDSLRPIVDATPGLRLDILQDLDLPRYKTLLASCDVGLSLRLPSSEMAQTTFPSKVIEIAGDGLLLISTCVSDITQVFDDTEAVLLHDASPGGLGRALIAITQDRAAATVRAGRGMARVAESFSPEAVGSAIIAFLGLDGRR